MVVSDPLTAALAAVLVLTLIVAAGLGWVCYRLLVDRGHLLLRLDAPERGGKDRIKTGLRAGAYLSDFALPARGGGFVTLSGLTGKPLLLVFVRPDCLFSRAFARELAALESSDIAPMPVLVVSGDIGDPQRCHPFGGLPGWVLLDPPGQVAHLMRVTATPAGYLTDAGRRTVGGLLRGPAALLAAARGEPVPDERDLPRAVSAIPDAPTFTLTPLPPGTVAPNFTLPTVNGGEWSLIDHRGAPLTLVFSDPGCPPCAALLAKLGQHDTTGMVLVSRGDAEENRWVAESAGLTAPVLLQRSREVARDYRVLETPAAYRIDEGGAIAAGPAIGAEEVLALIARASASP
jgi:peroxiredoxin